MASTTPTTSADRRPQESSEAVGFRLMMLRCAFGYATRREFCADFGFKESRYSNWESGYRRPAIDAGLAICQKLGVTLDWLYRGEMVGIEHSLVLKLKEAETLETERIQQHLRRLRLSNKQE